jgi:hypothetical protein
MKDELLSRYMQLSLMKNIPDMERYAQEWYLLASRASVQDRPNLAEACITRWKHYMSCAPGEYVRLFDGPTAELVEVPR